MKVYKAKEYIKNGDSETATNDSSNCTVYAFASAFNVDYETAMQEMSKRFGRVPKKGIPTTKLVGEMTEMMNSSESVFGHKVTQAITQPKQQTKWKLGGDYKMRRMRMSSFLKSNPQGTFYVITRGHALTIKDGDVIDTLVNKDHSKYIIKHAFKIEPAV